MYAQKILKAKVNVRVIKIMKALITSLYCPEQNNLQKIFTKFF